MIEQKFLMKDGRAALLRTPTEADAARYLDLLKALAKETSFMLWEPEELNSVTRLELEVSAENQRAIGFYLHRGFQMTGCIPQVLRYADRTADIHIMTRSL